MRDSAAHKVSRNHAGGYPRMDRRSSFTPEKSSFLTQRKPKRTISHMSWIQSTADGCVVNVRVIPRASKNQIQGVLGDALKIRLQAPPVDDKANKALVRFLAEILKRPARNIRLLSGETGRNKRILLSGMVTATACILLKITDPEQAP
jgi:uncharacterized protein